MWRNVNPGKRFSLQPEPPSRLVTTKRLSCDLTSHPLTVEIFAGGEEDSAPEWATTDERVYERNTAEIIHNHESRLLWHLNCDVPSLFRRLSLS